SFVIRPISELSPLAESLFMAEWIALTTIGTDSLTFIESFHSDSRTPYATGDPDPVETYFFSIMLPRGSSALMCPPLSSTPPISAWTLSGYYLVPNRMLETSLAAEFTGIGQARWILYSEEFALRTATNV